MTKPEKQLLENLLNSLDRLFDGEIRVIDLHALFFATSQALAASDLGRRIESVVTRLAELLRRPCVEEVRRDEALRITDDLRHYLADALPFPETRA